MLKAIIISTIFGDFIWNGAQSFGWLSILMLNMDNVDLSAM